LAIFDITLNFASYNYFIIFPHGHIHSPLIFFAFFDRYHRFHVLHKRRFTPATISRRLFFAAIITAFSRLHHAISSSSSSSSSDFDIEYATFDFLHHAFQIPPTFSRETIISSFHYFIFISAGFTLHFFTMPSNADDSRHAMPPMLISFLFG